MTTETKSTTIPTEIIELRAKHAAERARFESETHNQTTALIERQRAEMNAAHVAAGLPELPADDAAPTVEGEIRLPAWLTSLIPMLLALLFGRGGGGQASPFPMGSTANPNPAGGDNPDPNPFAGPVSPPADAPPGVPIDLTTGQPIVIPPPTSAPRTGAPLPGTGTHPGCTVDNPCAKHGGTGAAVAPAPAPGAAPVPGSTPAAPAVPDLSIDDPTKHYDGRPRTDPKMVCTVYKPCAECIDRSRKPVITITTRTAS